MGSETRRATKIVTIRLTPEEHAQITAAGAERGYGPSTFARVAVAEALGLPRPKVRRKRDALDVAVAKALGELGRIGNNVNQLARVANARGELPTVAAVATMRQEVEELTRAILSLRETSSE